MHSNARGTCAMFHSLVIIVLLVFGCLLPRPSPVALAQPYTVNHSLPHRQPDTFTPSEFFRKIRALSRVPNRGIALSPGYASQAEPLHYSSETRSPYSVNVDFNFHDPQDSSLLLSPFRSPNSASSKNRDIRRHPVANKPKFVPYTQPDGEPYLQRAPRLFGPQRPTGNDQYRRRPNEAAGPPSQLPSQNYGLPGVLRIPGTCDGGDCLKDNKAVSLYSPPSSGSARRPPLLLISNTAANGEKQAQQYVPRTPQSVSASLQRPEVLSYPGTPAPNLSEYTQFSSILNGVDRASYSSYTGNANVASSTQRQQQQQQQQFSGGAELSDYVPSDKLMKQPSARTENSGAANTRSFDYNRYGAASPSLLPSEVFTQRPYSNGQSSDKRGATHPKARLDSTAPGVENADREGIRPLKQDNLDTNFLQEPLRYLNNGHGSYGNGPTPPPRLNFRESTDIPTNPADGASSPSPSPPPDYGHDDGGASPPRYAGGAELSDYTVLIASTASPRTSRTFTKDDKSNPNEVYQVYSVPQLPPTQKRNERPTNIFRQEVPSPIERQSPPPYIVLNEYTGQTYPVSPFAPELQSNVKGLPPAPIPPAEKHFPLSFYTHSQLPRRPVLPQVAPGYLEHTGVPTGSEGSEYLEEPQYPEPTQPRKYMTRGSLALPPKFDTPSSNVPPEYTPSVPTTAAEYGATDGPELSISTDNPEYPLEMSLQPDSTPYQQQMSFQSPQAEESFSSFPAGKTASTTPSYSTSASKLLTMSPFTETSEGYQSSGFYSPNPSKESVSVEKTSTEATSPQGSPRAPGQQGTPPPDKASPPEGYTAEYPYIYPPEEPPRTADQETIPPLQPFRPQLPPVKETTPPQQPSEPSQPFVTVETTGFSPSSVAPVFPKPTLPPRLPELPQQTMAPGIPGVPGQPTVSTVQVYTPQEEITFPPVRPEIPPEQPTRYPRPSTLGSETPKKPFIPPEFKTPVSSPYSTPPPTRPGIGTSPQPSFPETQTSAYPVPSEFATTQPSRIASTRPTPPLPFTPSKVVPNRIRGKAHVVCEEIGLQFRITTLFPFTGQIFAHDRKRVPGCVHTFTEAAIINVTLPYLECGIRNIGERRAETQYHMQIIVVFEQNDGKSTIQSFIAQCQHQKVQYQKSTIPKRIEEALEELRLVPTKLEQKAPIPECIMRIVKEEDHGHEGDGVEVDMVDLGQPMRIEWSLVPESGLLSNTSPTAAVEQTVFIKF
uniref:ZP domain-containing protein n=1 Tax=Ascaris lumbricoides TaxID=6252 RepID=A0A9J2Q067_ASCLU